MRVMAPNPGELCLEREREVCFLGPEMSWITKYVISSATVVQETRDAPELMRSLDWQNGPEVGKVKMGPPARLRIKISEFVDG